MREYSSFKLVALLLVVAGCSSAATGWYLQRQVNESVYVIGAVTVTDPDRLPAYRAISEPLAHELAGYTPLAFEQPRVLEGELPLDALYFVERYDSMAQLEKFLSDLEASGARALRDAAADVHFLLVLPAYSE